MAETERANALREKEKAEKSAEETRLVADFQSKILSDLSVDEFGHEILVEQRKDLAESLARIGRRPEEIEATLASFDAAVRSSNATTVAQRVLEASVFAPAVAKIDQEYGTNPRARRDAADAAGRDAQESRALRPRRSARLAPPRTPDARLSAARTGTR